MCASQDAPEKFIFSIHSWIVSCNPCLFFFLFLSVFEFMEMIYFQGTGARFLPVLLGCLASDTYWLSDLWKSHITCLSFHFLIQKMGEVVPLLCRELSNKCEMLNTTSWHSVSRIPFYLLKLLCSFWFKMLSYSWLQGSVTMDVAII